jgi:hypothetical protein
MLALQFAALAPEPLEGRWEEVLREATAARETRQPRGRTRARHGYRRRYAIVFAAVALVAVATATALAVRAFVPDKGIIGLPPVGATPSAPKSGVLEMHSWLPPVRRQDTVLSRQSWVYADGRLIRLGLSRANGRLRRGFIEQRLTGEGVKLLRAEIVSAGGFGHAQPPPGSTSLNQTFGPAYIEVRKGDRLVPLRWARDLKRLEARLADPESWLPASAWKQTKFRAYVPSRFEVCARAVVVPDLDKPAQTRPVPIGPARIVALLPKAAQSVLRVRAWNARGAAPGCFAVTTNEARSLAKALDGAGPATARKGRAIRLHYTFDAPGPNRQVWISFDPFLPHGEVARSPQ